MATWPKRFDDMVLSFMCGTRNDYWHKNRLSKSERLHAYQQGIRYMLGNPLDKKGEQLLAYAIEIGLIDDDSGDDDSGDDMDLSPEYRGTTK